MAEIIQRPRNSSDWRHMYFGKEENVELCQMLDFESGKPDYPCSFVVHASHVVDVVAAEILIEEIKAAIKLARQWNRELLIKSSQ